MPNLVQLQDLRVAAKRRINREGDDDAAGFITKAEWNAYVNGSWRELYDLVVTAYQDQFCKIVEFDVVGGQDTYTWTAIGAGDFYKALGVDMAVSAPNYWQPLKRFNLAERGMGNPLMPLALGIPGLYDLRYQLRGDAVVFMQPVPAIHARLLYVPVAPAMVADTDTIDDVNGYGEYVVLDAAIKGAVKEGSDFSGLLALKNALRARIIESLPSRDAGSPQTITDTSTMDWY